jgi:hypothetical protein
MELSLVVVVGESMLARRALELHKQHTRLPTLNPTKPYILVTEVDQDCLGSPTGPGGI